MSKIFIVNSKTNTPITRSLPWVSARLGTRSIGVKEFVYDNFIENVEDTLAISIMKNDQLQLEINVEKGNYELDYILTFIKVSLEEKNIKNIKFLFNQATWKIGVLNESKFIVHLNEIAQKFFKLPSQILPSTYIKSREIFNICDTKSVYIRIKNLKDGMYTDSEKDSYGEIIFQSSLRALPGAQTIDLVTYEKPTQYEFFNKRIDNLEIHITDENGKYINLQNIKIVLYFETELL